MSEFVHERVERTTMVREHKAYQRVMADLFKDYKNLEFAANAKLLEPFTLPNLINALLHHFTEGGVRALFPTPTTVKNQLETAHDLFMRTFSDDDPRPVDIHTTLAIQFILVLYPIQNNRREARRKEIEKFLTRTLQEPTDETFVAQLHELLFADEIAYSRWITVFRYNE
ncbi:hypothetical protein [Streptomyces sp. CHB9.2]|uniref:hypothetical protein n=1 Tax=Streptomyces sp. CHB9.2 TaxID=2841670 RepID=UPI0020954A84|nr:hypothetical protein [Streptomyces sp. CHB9.2]MCO6704840.1 hypothetical protein [Streptomyces sp. CHB9.2]